MNINVIKGFKNNNPSSTIPTQVPSCRHLRGKNIRDANHPNSDVKYERNTKMRGVKNPEVFMDLPSSYKRSNKSIKY